MKRVDEFYKVSAEERIVLDQLRAYEDRKMLAESEKRGSRLLLPISSPIRKDADNGK